VAAAETSIVDLDIIRSNPGPEPVRTLDIGITVLTKAGARLASALVLLSHEDPEVVVARGATGDDGRIMFKGLAADRLYRASATRNGYFGNGRDLGRLSENAVETIELTAVGTVKIPVLEREEFPPRDQLAKVNTLFANRYLASVSTLENTAKDPVVQGSRAYQSAQAFLIEAGTNPRVDDRGLVASYEELARALQQATEHASDRQKVAYQEVLQASTRALLDRLALNNPAELRADAKAGVERAAAAIRVAGLDPGALHDAWAADVSGSLQLPSVQQITSLLV
jgi:hypothetical protein